MPTTCWGDEILIPLHGERALTRQHVQGFFIVMQVVLGTLFTRRYLGEMYTHVPEAYRIAQRPLANRPGTVIRCRIPDPCG